MNEADHNRITRERHVHEVAMAVTKELSDRGQIMEGGWRGFALLCGVENDKAPALREAYYSGAQHLFGSIMSILEPGAEPTEKDLHRMTLIHEELDRWVQAHKKTN
jgi:hypothetical protein